VPVVGVRKPNSCGFDEQPQTFWISRSNESRSLKWFAEHEFGFGWRQNRLVGGAIRKADTALVPLS